MSKRLKYYKIKRSQELNKKNMENLQPEEIKEEDVRSDMPAKEVEVAAEEISDDIV